MIIENELVFTLQKYMTMKDFLLKGYKKLHVLLLFIRLQDEGFGVYIPGKKGRQNCPKFICNQKCPDTYSIPITVKQKKQKKDFDNKPSIFDDILSKKRTPKELPIFYGTGYICSIADNYVFLDRCKNAGYATIEEAVGAIWEDIHNLVTIISTRHMSKQEGLVSELRGHSFYRLKMNELS